MSSFRYQHRRRLIHFSDHAMDRWWERCQANEVHGRQAAMDLLRERLVEARWVPYTPPWSRLSRFHRARAEGSLLLDKNSAFIVNRNATGDLVAVTYIEAKQEALAA